MLFLKCRAKGSYFCWIAATVWPKIFRWSEIFLFLPRDGASVERLFDLFLLCQSFGLMLQLLHATEAQLQFLLVKLHHELLR